MSKDVSRKSIFDTPLLRTKVKSSNVSLFPEAGLGYLAGPVLALIPNAVVNVYLTQYWDKVLNLRTWGPLFETLLPILSAIIIVIGNLLVGKLMERKPSFAGKARPLILLGLPIIAVALLLLFLVPFPEGATAANPSVLAMIFITVGYNLYYALAWPVYYASHAALVSLSTRDGSKRGLLATASNAAQLGAAGLAGMVGPFLIDAIGLLPKEENPTEATLKAINGKWTILMIIMIGCLVVGCLLEYFFTRERISEEHFKMRAANGNGNGQETKKSPMRTQIKICLRDKYWWLIIIFFFLYQFGGMMKNNDATWFSQAFLGENKVALAGTINALGAIPTALGMVLVWPLANKFGKSKVIRTGALIGALLGSIGFLVLLPSVSDSEGSVTALAVVAFCLKALGTCPAMYISLALMADVLDHQEAVYGVRTDGFTMAIYGSIMVAMTGITNGIIVGLNSVNPYSASDPLGNRILHTSLFFGGEVICYLIIFFIFLMMNVEKFSKFDQKAIIADQKAKVLEGGGVWVDPEDRAKIE